MREDSFIANYGLLTFSFRIFLRRCVKIILKGKQKLIGKEHGSCNFKRYFVCAWSEASNMLTTVKRYPLINILIIYL